VEVKIGVHATAEEVAKAVSQAIDKGGLFTLTDSKGRQLLVPGAVIGYVSLGESERRGVGFGTL